MYLGIQCSCLKRRTLSSVNQSMYFLIPYMLEKDLVNFKPHRKFFKHKKVCYCMERLLEIRDSPYVFKNFKKDKNKE